MSSVKKRFFLSFLKRIESSRLKFGRFFLIWCRISKILLNNFLSNYYFTDYYMYIYWLILKFDHFMFQIVLHVTWTTSLNWPRFKNLVCLFWEIVKFHSLKTSNKCYVVDLTGSFVQLNFITSFWWCKSKIKRWNRTRLSWSRSVTSLQAYWLDIWKSNCCWLGASLSSENS